MNIKIIQHLMPWELDNALLSFSQLKKSKFYLPKEVNITIDTVLNLSSYIINWDDSKLPKEYFLSKYDNISSLLVDYNHIKRTYQGDKLYGHLDFQKEIVSEEVDYYIGTCPDMYFSEHLLSYLTQLAPSIPNKYFVITPQISKLWDYTWDEITNPQYLNIPYASWDNVDIFDIMIDNQHSDQEINLRPTNKSKWAGWFDLYSKSFYEDLVPSQEDWSGYGPWDWYSLIITEHLKSQGVDFQQYLLEGETIFERSVGPLKGEKGSKLVSHYKDLLVLNDIPNQRQQFESRMQEYLNKGLQMLKDKQIL